MGCAGPTAEMRQHTNTLRERANSISRSLEAAVSPVVPVCVAASDLKQVAQLQPVRELCSRLGDVYRGTRAAFVMLYHAIDVYELGGRPIGEVDVLFDRLESLMQEVAAVARDVAEVANGLVGIGDSVARR